MQFSRYIHFADFHASIMSIFRFVRAVSVRSDPTASRVILHSSHAKTFSFYKLASTYSPVPSPVKYHRPPMS